MWRRLGAVLAGAGMVVVVVALLQWVGSMMYPLPEGLDPFDPADAGAFAAHLSNMPLSSWVLAFGSEILGAYLGALVAAAIVRDGRLWVPGVVIASSAVASISNWRLFPHPVWFMVGQPIVYVLAFLLVRRMLRRSGQMARAR